jgi:metal-sulfur cluster biosynthetic enzyme
MSVLYDAIIEGLKSIIDPETGADVVRMRLIENLEVSSEGQVSYTFRPSSPLCPIAVYLVQQIMQTVAIVPGVTGQTIEVTGYVAAEELTKLINQNYDLEGLRNLPSLKPQEKK